MTDHLSDKNCVEPVSVVHPGVALQEHLKFSGVAHVFNCMNPGGAELRTIDVVRKTALAFDFIAVSGSAGSLDGELRQAGHSVHHQRLTLRHMWHFMRLLHMRRYRVVHSHLGLASGPVIFCAWLTRVPCRIAHFRSDAVGGRSSSLKSFFLWISRFLINRLATDIIGVSPGSLQHGWNTGWESDRRCRVIPNGFDVKRLREEAVKARTESATLPRFPGVTVLNIGRVDPVKNRGRAVTIWRKFAEQHQSQLLLVGELNDADTAVVAAALRQTADGSDVALVGVSTEVAAYIGISDVLLATSTREGLPGIVLESLAIGTPVVASDLPGARWIASLLPGIELRSLDSDDCHWVAAVGLARRKDRGEIASAFDRSPFLLDSAVATFCLLWGVTPDRHYDRQP